MMKVGNLEVFGVIYKIKNIVNGKVYIGQTINGFNRRYIGKGKDIERVYNSTGNVHLKNSIFKYGTNNFEVNKVFDVAFSREELNLKEKIWISYFDCIKNGYNISGGGSNGSSFTGKTEEDMNIIKEKISKANKGKLKGENNPMYGKQHTEETKDKIKNTRIQNGLTRKVKQIDKKSFEVIKVWDSIAEATRYFNLSRSAIKNVLDEKRLDIKSSKGFYWEYVDVKNIKYSKIRKDD